MVEVVVDQVVGEVADNRARQEHQVDRIRGQQRVNREDQQGETCGWNGRENKAMFVHRRLKYKTDIVRSALMFSEQCESKVMFVH